MRIVQKKVAGALPAAPEASFYRHLQRIINPGRYPAKNESR